jgi:phenylacetate-coenzyme A ligase PaaK-like adenylate-forming protein
MSLDFAQPAARRTWIKHLLGPMDEAKWDKLARELFAWQFAGIPAFRRLCLGHGVTPDNLPSWSNIPAVPQQLFKREKLFAHGSTKSAAIYETSGTTTGQPGRQHLLNTDIYRTVSIEAARRVGPLNNNALLHFLTPSPAEARHSSLSAMFGFWQKHSDQPGSSFWLRKNQFEFADFREALTQAIDKQQPVAICGTAFSFVHLIDAWVGLPCLTLPDGSWVLETGGFKGRSREVAKDELYAQIGRLFTVPNYAIWNEYGMSELSSQAYAHGTHGLHGTPPWTRVLVCDPTTGREVRVGQRGLIKWFDLANVDSVFALQTLDLAERTTGGFRLIGRMARTEPRGCSLSAEDLATAAAH